jgi:hypothetical protein
MPEPFLMFSVANSEDPAIDGLEIRVEKETWPAGPAGTWSPSSFDKVTIDLRRSKSF